MADAINTKESRRFIFMSILKYTSLLAWTADHQVKDNILSIPYQTKILSITQNFVTVAQTFFSETVT